MAAEIIFFTALALIAYSYVGYPILLMSLSFLFPRQTRRANITPRLSLIITAHNEEKDIRAKLENALSLDYPQDRYEIIVASDCSTDHTDELVRSFAAQGVILYREAQHHGKTITQYHAVKRSSGEILVFSDATTRYENQALRAIVRSFADPTVGCVAGQLIYVDESTSTVNKGCSSYWNYEKILKHFESRLGSLIGVSGCLYAVRRSCHARLRDDMIDDFVVASEIRAQGLRTVYEPDAIAFERTNNSYGDEFKMRVRIIKQTLSAMARYRNLLDWRTHQSFAFQMISHKVRRYLVPFFLIAAFIANEVLVDWQNLAGLLSVAGVQRWLTTSSLLTKFLDLAALGQSAFYLLAVGGYVLTKLGFKPLGVVALPLYFVLVNTAVLFAFVKLISGEGYVVWEPIRAPDPTPREQVRPLARG